MAFPQKENPAVSSNAGTHEVPVTKEAGVGQHLESVSKQFAEEYLRNEESRIQAAFDKVHADLEEVQHASPEANAKHAGFTRDPLTPVTPKQGKIVEYEVK